MPFQRLRHVLKTTSARRLTAAGCTAAALVLAAFGGAHAAEPIILEVAAADVCRGVQNFKAIEPGLHFTADTGRLYCLSRIGNIARSTQVRHKWYREGEERFRISLPVRPPSWHTYSMVHISGADIGRWRVEISDSRGNILKTLFFEITP
jgi:hypothetical protein